MTFKRFLGQSGVFVMKIHFGTNPKKLGCSLHFKRNQNKTTQPTFYPATFIDLFFFFKYMLILSNIQAIIVVDDDCKVADLQFLRWDCIKN